MKRLCIILMGVMFFVASCEKNHELSSLDELSSLAELNTSNLEYLEGYVSFEKNYYSEEQKEDIEVVNGIIHFKSLDVFQKIAFNNEYLASKEYLKISALFDSKVNKYDRFLGESEKLTSKEEALRLIKKYNNSVELNHDDIDIADKSIYDNFIPSTEQPYFYIGDVINLYKNGKEFVIIDGDESKIERILNGNESLNNVAVVEIKTNSKKLRSTSSRCQNLYGELYHGNLVGYSKCDGTIRQTPVGVVNGQYRYRMSAVTFTTVNVKIKRFGLLWAYGTDKRLNVNHTLYMYVDGVQVMFQPYQQTWDNYNITDKKAAISDATEFTPISTIYLFENELSRLTINIENNVNSSNPGS